MANQVSIQVNDVTVVLTRYNRIKVYRSTSIDGTYLEITDSSTRIALNVQDSLYTYIDSTGNTDHFYATSYFNTGDSIESALSAAVAAISITNQLRTNMQVVITLSADIANTDGITLGDELEYFFTTTYDPLYSSVRKLRLEVGAFIREMPDDTLNLAIFEASLMAGEINWVKNATSDFFRFARREWTTCKAAEILLNNIVGVGGLSSKRLDNFEVKYDTKTGIDLLNKINDCLARWEKELISGGAAVQTPRGFVKGEFDRDAPHVGRMWEKNLLRPSAPGSNARYRPVRSRRYIGGWKPGGRLF